MGDILGGLYSFGNRAKRQLRDAASNPMGYLQQAAELLADGGGRSRTVGEVVQKTFDPSKEDITRASDWWDFGPSGAMAGVVKRAAVDPIAQAVAARMIGQLEAIPRVSGLEALGKSNLPAAYAGDQRSMQAVQRAINEAETGLESPGRRKVLKQGAAMAARSAVPDAVVDALGANAVKNVMKEAVAPVTIPDESIQAAISAALNNVMKSKVYRGAWDEMGTHPSISDYGDELVELIGQAGVDKLDRLLGGLTSPAIAKKYGLPEEVVQAYIDKVGVSPENLLGEWANSRESLESFWDSTDKHRFWDYGFGDMPEKAPEDLVNKAVAEHRARMEAGHDDPYEPLYDMYMKMHRDRNVGFYEKLLGEKGFRDLRMKHGDVFGNPAEHYEQMEDAIMDNDRLFEWLQDFGQSYELPK